MRRLVPLLAVLAVAAAAGAAPAGDGVSAAGVERRVEELVARVDPESDPEWATEMQGEWAARRLAELAERLTRPGATPRRFEALLATGAEAGPLTPPPEAATTRVERPGLRALSWRPPPEAEEDRPAAVALAEVAAGFGGTAPRAKFKVTSVDDGPPGFVTTVRVELDDPGDGAAGQRRADWRIAWSVTDDDRRVAIARIDLLDWQSVESEGPWFRDVAGAAIERDAALVRRLGLGADAWYGYLDTVGEPFLMGHHGIALGDVNGDGVEDLYVANATGLPNSLLVRGADGVLRDVAEEAGVAWLDDTKGVLLLDVDNDGDTDLVTAIGPTIVVARNDGAGRFTDLVHLRAPTPAAFYSLSAADYDLDGDLDIYGTRYVRLAYGVSVPIPLHDADNGPSNHLLRNDGEGRFTDVTAAVGLDVANSRFSLASAWGDYDDDGDPDLYVANDFGRNVLYRNDGGRFTDVSAAAGVEDRAAGMGAAFADYDGDGDLDLHVTNMWSSAGRRVAWQPAFNAGLAADDLRGVRRHALGDSLYRNAGDGTFDDVSDEAGVRVGRWGWGGRFADLDNDGREDLVVPNGFLTGAREHDL